MQPRLRITDFPPIGPAVRLSLGLTGALGLLAAVSGPQTRRIWTALGLIGVFELLAGPAVSRACAVCFGDGSDDWTAGFVAGTIMMLALPPSILLGGGFMIWRATRRQQARLAADDAASS